jgi:hypothetical protein
MTGIELISMRERLTELRALGASRVIHTEEGRHIIAHLARIVETIVDGKPGTELPRRHHV